MARRHSFTDKQIIGIISIIVGLLLLSPLGWLVGFIFSLVPYALIGLGIFFLIRK